MRHSILIPFERLPYFTIKGFLQLAGEEISSDAHARTALYRWIKAGYLIPLKRGAYMHHRFYERHRQDPTFSLLVSAIVLPQSYLSLEFVLQQYSILTEVTFPITAVTPKNTRVVVNPLGTFVYRHIQPGLYRGFSISEAYGVPYAQASLAKALFDYLYFRPLPAYFGSFSLAEELRLNLDELTSADRDEFTSYVITSGKVKMRRILDNFRSSLWQP